MLRFFVPALFILAITACTETSEPHPEPDTATTGDDLVVLEEIYLTPRDTSDNVDSPAIWHGLDGQHWLLATAKQTDVILVNDASTGELICRVGGEGTALGQLDRPNGIAVVDDLMVVVERDNRRIQVFRLPSFEAVGVFGQERLRKPYGLTVYAEAPNRYVLYVTDNYETPDEQVPPDAELGERVQQYRFSVTDTGLDVEHVRAIGETTGAGVLRVVESIYADTTHNRLLIADELEGQSVVKIYNLEGQYTEQMIDATYFPNQAEGIALYTCTDGSGYWLMTDQGKGTNTFHLFDRITLDHVAAFSGTITLNTDGIALTQQPFANFAQGAFFAVHDDGNVAAFDWATITTTLHLTTACTR